MASWEHSFFGEGGGQSSEFSEKVTFFRQCLIGNITDRNGQKSLFVVISRCHSSEESIKVQGSSFETRFVWGVRLKKVEAEEDKHRESGGLPLGKFSRLHL